MNKSTTNRAATGSPRRVISKADLRAQLHRELYTAERATDSLLRNIEQEMRTAQSALNTADKCGNCAAVQEAQGKLDILQPLQREARKTWSDAYHALKRN